MVVAVQDTKNQIRKRRPTGEKESKNDPIDNKKNDLGVDAKTKTAKRHAKRTLAIVKSAGLQGAGIHANVAKIIENYQRDMKLEMFFFFVFLVLFNVNAMQQRDVSQQHDYSGALTQLILLKFNKSNYRCAVYRCVPNNGSQQCLSQYYMV